MNTPTPETNKAERITKYTGEYMVPTEVARKLERERDEWKAKYIQQNKDLGCEMMDPNGTIWDHAKTVWKRERDEARQAEVARKLERERDEARQALADSLYQAERELASALSDVNLYKTYIAEQGSSIIYRRASSTKKF